MSLTATTKNPVKVTNNTKIPLSVASGKIRVRKTVNMSNEDSKSEDEDEILQSKPRPSRKNFKATLDKKSAFAKPESVAIPMHVAEKDSDIVSQDEEFSENSVEALKLAIKTVKETARSMHLSKILLSSRVLNQFTQFFRLIK